MVTWAVVAELVRLNVAGVPTPATDAVTEYAPGVELAVAEILARPLLLVVAGLGVPSVAEAPLPGAANVTETPLTGLPLESVTNATRLLNAVLTAVLCVPPLDTVTCAAAPAVFVRLKLAGVPTPAAVAVTE